MASRIAIACAVLFVCADLLQAGDQDKEILKAIKGGQQFLKAAQRAGGGGGIPGLAVVGIGGNGKGSNYLTGLALIESGVPVNDPFVVKLARETRQEALDTVATYEISLAIMFLDRVGAKEDQGLIQFLTLRLMSGQTPDGAWSYACGLPLDPVEARQLAAELIKDVRLTTPDRPKPPKKGVTPRDDLDPGDPKAPKKDSPAPKKDVPKPDTKPKLHPSLEKYARAIKNGLRGGSTPALPTTAGDHSNTQFATVGLWCGRRHGVDVADALALIDKHYRNNQGADGGWTYSAVQGLGGSSSPAMTCAGLMGLAMGFGAKNLDDGAAKKADPDAVAQDKAVAGGLKYVGGFLAAAAAERDPRTRGEFAVNPLSSNLYFMWSLERVGMVYGLKTIGNVDWYDWGSKTLIASQQPNGSWNTNGFTSGSVENTTAFALLFLSRANLAEDLTTSMRNKIKDPGNARLRSPGDLGKMLKGTGQGSAGSHSAGAGASQPRGDNPAAETDKGSKLAAALIAADAPQRAELLVQYRDTKGGEYTDALAKAAAKLTGEAQTEVRDALAKRLTRMTAVTLNDFMRDRDRELRRGAALAIAAKGKARLPEFAKSLIRLIADDEPIVAQAARATLKSLSGEDYGPEAGATAADRGKAVVAWRTWWEKQKQ